MPVRPPPALDLHHVAHHHAPACIDKGLGLECADRMGDAPGRGVVLVDHEVRAACEGVIREEPQHLITTLWAAGYLERIDD